MSSWAIVVGIDQYPGTGDALAGLHGAVADACDFAEWALDPAGGDVDPNQLFFWTHPWPAPSPGRLATFLSGPQPAWDFDFVGQGQPDKTRPPRASEIVETIQRVGRDERNRAYEDQDEGRRRVFVFFAGHGVRAQETSSPLEQTCFVTGNFKPASGNTAQGLIGCSSLRLALLTDRFTEVLLFLDCCRVDASRLSMSAIPICDYSAKPSGRVWGIGHAAQDGYPAYETTTAPVRGAFSKTLVEGLRHYREPLTGELRVPDIQRYVLKNIGSATTQQQVPYFQCESPPDDPLILKGEPTAQQGPLVDLSALPTGAKVLLKNGMLDPVVGIEPLVAGADPIQLPRLLDGLYLLEVEDDTNRSKTFRQPSKDPVIVN